jgi:hypothetical protein
MARNRVFFPQAALDGWVASDRIDVNGDELTIKGAQRRYRAVEALRIIREVTGTPDGNELVGTVKSRAFLTELGAEILGGSMILGDNAYDVVPGFVGAPVGPFDDHKKSLPTGRAVSSDEDLLTIYLGAAR